MAWFYRYLIFRRLGKDVAGCRCIAKVVGLHLKNEYGYFGKGVQLEAQAQKTRRVDEKNRFRREAIDSYTKAINANSKFIWSYCHRGEIYSTIERSSEAFKDFRQAIEIASREALPYNYRGRLYQENGRFGDALKDYNAAIKIDPHYWRSYHDRGIFYFKRRQYRQAIADLEHCRRWDILSSSVTKYLQLAKDALRD